MKTKTILKRLEKRYKGSKSTIAYRTIIDFCNGTNKTYRNFKGFNTIIRPTESSKRGVVCYLDDFKDLLDLIGIKYEFGNDSPRGGASGNYIKITHSINN